MLIHSSWKSPYIVKIQYEYERLHMFVILAAGLMNEKVTKRTKQVMFETLDNSEENRLSFCSITPILFEQRLERLHHM
jgi:hypothetical protein